MKMVGASKEIEATSTRGRSNGKGSIANDLVRLQKSPASAGWPENVLIVMDGLEEFSLEPLQWVLENIALMACCTITILGVMPWLNIPCTFPSLSLSCIKIYLLARRNFKNYEGLSYFSFPFYPCESILVKKYSITR